MPIPPIRIVIAGVDNFSKTVNKSLKNIDRMGKGISSVGKKISMGITVPLAGAAIASTKASLDINKAMANVGTLIPGNLKRLQDLKRGVQDLSIDVGRSSTNIAEGLFQVISAFGDTSETMEKLTINSRAAVAGLSTVEEAISLTSAVTKAFGDTSAEATQKVVDLAFKTNELGQTTFAQMAQALPRVTALSKDLNVSLEEMFGVMATATGVTGNTNEVATQLGGALAALIKPTRDMEIALEKLGFTGRRAGADLIAEKGLHGAFKALEDITARYDVPLSKVLGRKEGLILVTSLLGAQSDTYTEKLQKMSNASGSAEKAFKAQTEGINKAGFAFNRAREKMIVFLQRLGDALAPTLLKITNFADRFLSKLLKMSPAFLKTAIVIGAVLASIGPLLVITGKLIVAFSTVAGVVAKAGGIIAILSNPITIAIAGILLLVTTLRTAGVKWRSIWRLMFRHAWPIVAMVEFIIENWKRIAPFFKLTLMGIIGIFKIFASTLKVILTPVMWVFDVLIDSLKWIMDKGLRALEFLASKVLSPELQERIGFVGVGGQAQGGEALDVQKRIEERNTKQESTLNVKFENAPQGMRIDKEGRAPVDFEVERGSVLPALG